jgi:ankyrin repeat protein
MISKTRMLSLVKELRWQEVRQALAENPRLLAVRDKRGRTWLHICCAVDIGKRSGEARDSIKMAELLLKQGIDINDAAFTEDNFRATPLWYAVAFGKNIDLASYLLRRGSDPNSCLFAAAYNHDTAAIRLLIKHGADIDPVTEGATPFLFAVQWSRFEAAQELLKLGADANYQDSKRMTALHYMLKKGTDKKYIRMLLDYGARGDIRNKDGMTAAAIMMKKRDADFRTVGEELLKARA